MIKIVEYNQKYDESIKELLVELQEYIVLIDKDKYNILTPEYKEEEFLRKMEEIKKYEGKMFLARENNNIIGLIIGVINNEELRNYNFSAPKRGRITELIVTKSFRTKGIGELLIKKMEDYLISVGCKAILIDVFGYNEIAKNFYQKQGYINRNYEIMKKFE